MESRRPELDENIINVTSIAFDNCLAHKIFRDEAQLGRRVDDFKVIAKQQQISAKLIEQNEPFLHRVVKDVIDSRASEAYLLNGSALRQSISGDVANADAQNGSGLFFYAQQPLVNKFNQLSGQQQGTVWKREPYVTADSHNNKLPGDNYSAAIDNKDDRAHVQDGTFYDPSNLLMLYAQMYKVARDHKPKEIHFDFYAGDIEANKRLHKFLNDNKDFIPRNLRLRIRTYQGTGEYVDSQMSVNIVDEPVIIGEGDLELDFNQAYKNMIKAHENEPYPVKDILATFMPRDEASPQEKLAAAERLKAFKQLRQEELLALVAEMNAVKQLLPRVGEDKHLTDDAQAFADSLDAFYWKIDAELTKTKNAIKNPARRAKQITACDAVAAADRMRRFLRTIVSSAELPTPQEKFNAHIENLAAFSREFNSKQNVRIAKDVAKGVGISFGSLLLAGAIGAAIGFGVGFAIGGPAGAVAVGILGAIIAGAIAAAIGGGIAAPVSGVSIYRKQRERREAEAAEKAALDLADAPRMGFAAG